MHQLLRNYIGAEVLVKTLKGYCISFGLNMPTSFNRVPGYFLSCSKLSWY